MYLLILSNKIIEIPNINKPDNRNQEPDNRNLQGLFSHSVTKVLHQHDSA